MAKHETLNFQGMNFPQQCMLLRTALWAAEWKRRKQQNWYQTNSSLPKESLSKMEGGEKSCLNLYSDIFKHINYSQHNTGLFHWGNKLKDSHLQDSHPILTQQFTALSNVSVENAFILIEEHTAYVILVKSWIYLHANYL